ncbi:MAG: hypothetical protein ERJ69_06945 [Aphanocapsa feldmannii 288cV]|nr:MAG: hypothetical protein ERJ69_06945 [Aphanocapsa feldmannii 288cV]
MTSSGEERAPLPAPYISPSQRLKEDLRDLFASQRLRLRQLWRLNREGALWLPRFWPRQLTPLFWPLLLVLLLGMALFAAQRLPQQVAATVPRPVPVGSTSTGSPTGTGGRLEPAAAAMPGERPLEDRPAVPDPLIDLLQEWVGSSHLLRTEPDHNQERLVLVVDDAWRALPQRERQRLADAWCSQLPGLGFAELELVDPLGQRLARSARIGSGMLLWQG